MRAPKTAEQEAAGQFADPIYVQESFATISRMIGNEKDERALESEIFGLGHLKQDESVAILTRYETCSSDDIRYAVAWSLGCFPDDLAAIESLMRLSDDPDDDVRNWSLFALGTQSDSDAPRLRDVLARHVEDSCAEAREEAIAALAKRRDTRAVLPLLRLMESGSYFMHHERDFEALVEEERRGEEGWGTEDFIDALYARYPDLLPPREGRSEDG